MVGIIAGVDIGGGIVGWAVAWGAWLSEGCIEGRFVSVGLLRCALSLPVVL